ncbi:MAG: BrnT family toxin [Pyrinomonadaceae bacterium]
MEFEYDAAKSISNKERHGIDFEEGQQLWKDPFAFSVPSRYADEPRSLVIGMIKETCWTAIVTHREERIRIISIRRSRTYESKTYDKRRGIG